MYVQYTVICNNDNEYKFSHSHIKIVKINCKDK